MRFSQPKQQGTGIQPMVIRTSTNAPATDPSLTLCPSDSKLETKSLDELKRQIVACQLELTELIIGTLQKAIELGLLLLQVREQLPYGKFLDWIDSDLHPACGVKRRTAQRYMHLARKSELILSRIEELTSFGDAVETSASLAAKTIRRLKIADGERLIAQHNPKQSDTDNVSVMLTPVEEALRCFTHRAIGASEIHRVVLPTELNRIQPAGPCIFSVAEDRSNLAAVRQLCEYRSPTTDSASFLWIRGRGMETWLPLLNAFPRLCVSGTSVATKPAQSQWWLYGLITPSLFDTFSNAVAHLGDVLIPYLPPSDLPLIPQNTKEQLDNFTIE